MLNRQSTRVGQVRSGFSDLNGSVKFLGRLNGAELTRFPDTIELASRVYVEVDAGYFAEEYPLEIYDDAGTKKVRVKLIEIRFFEYDSATGIMTNLQEEVPIDFDVDFTEWVFVDAGVSLKPLDEKYIYTSATGDISDNPAYSGVE